MTEDIKISEDEQKRVLMYVVTNPGMPKYKISGITGVSIEKVEKMIEEGLLVQESGGIKKGRKQNIQGSSRERLLHSLREGIQNDSMKKQDKSKLLNDLEKIKNFQENNNNIEEMEI